MTPPRFTNPRVRTLIGSVFWIITLLIILPRPFDAAWGPALLLLAPLVLLPVGLESATTGSTFDWPQPLWQVVMIVQMPAAVCLGLAYLLPRGVLATSLALPWLMTTGLIALCGMMRVWKRGVEPLADVSLDAGLIFIAVGGAWAVSDRLGFRPLGFDATIVLLTAVHFHYAGFILPIVTGLAMRQGKRWTATMAGVGVIAGVPLVALGITTTQLGLGPSQRCRWPTIRAGGRWW